MYPVKIAPSVIAADFGYLRADLARAEQGGADMLHVDIMDGHFVSNITFGPDIVKTMRKHTKLPFDVHLMISKPRQYVTKFVEAGANNITIHVECEDQIRTCIDEIKYYDCKAGLCVKPKTPLSAVKDQLKVIDRLLIMTVEPRLRRPAIHARDDGEGGGGRKVAQGRRLQVRHRGRWRVE